MAFDLCCADEHASSHDDGSSKSEKTASHCPMSAHHSLAVIKDLAFTPPVITAAKSDFIQPSFHELLVGERLIEPPSRA